MKPAKVFDRIRSLAQNLWWTWDPGAQRLFASLDPALWRASGQDPLRTLDQLPPARAESISRDADFEKQLSQCEHRLEQYLSHKTWFQKAHPRSRMLVAYFCAEYAVAECLPQYSGGLGVLAGDHVKAASDLGIPFIGIGLLYRNGFYTQAFNADGSTRIIYPRLDFNRLPITDTGKAIEVPMGRGKIHAKIWRQLVGRVPIYLLDTDIAENKPADRGLTAHLYGGDREYRIRQEILLGIGGLVALEALKISPTVYHLNEGHAAFCALERLRRLIASGAGHDDARAKVRHSTVFTTHTPVPAGNDRFDPRLALRYLHNYARALKISDRDLLAYGREDPSNDHEEFCMTVLALKLAEHCNGVAQLHGQTSRAMWMKVYGASRPEDVPIGAITNGIHTQTWLAEEMRPVYETYLKIKWLDASPTESWWNQAGRVPDQVLWNLRRALRARLVMFARQCLHDELICNRAPAEDLAESECALSENALTIGFARRFATYKRAPLIFHDARRLARILGDHARPVQLLFAGKAHPQDLGGQHLAAEIYKYAHQPAFRGKVVLLENYDLQLGRMLTSGCDVWLNNPIRPQEASGTSGMKPPLHGGINCSILDGWWPEAFDGTNGWAIGDGRTFKSRAQQDRYDAGCIYDLLENQIVPEFYRRDRAGLPRGWIKRMKRSMQTVCGQFNTHRMVGQYVEQYYLPAST